MLSSSGECSTFVREVNCKGSSRYQQHRKVVPAKTLNDTAHRDCSGTRITVFLLLTAPAFVLDTLRSTGMTLDLISSDPHSNSMSAISHSHTRN